MVDYRQRYCDKHKPATTQTNADRYENRKQIGGKYFKFYHSKQWQKASQLYKLSHPCCEHCLKEGVIRKADVTDHIQELRDRWDLRLDEKNFQALCHYHHNLKTRKEREKRATLKL
ncbi:hypothetical protein IGI42_001840 [Enterococcus sp. AZ109]